MAGLFLIGREGDLVALEQAEYPSEDLLQRLLADYPDLLAGDQMDRQRPRKLLFLGREVGVPDAEGASDRWAVDHVFVDQDGVLTLVEVKRATDSRIRREVVGQLLDYGANAVRFWPPERVAAMLGDGEVEPGRRLRDAFGSDLDPDDFLRRVADNLEAGHVRLVIVADRIPDELARVIEFLNAQMSPAEVLGVEIPMFEGAGLRTLAPRVVGRTQEAVQRKQVGARALRVWDEASFFQVVAERLDEAGQAFVRRYFDWVVGQGWRVVFGRGVKEPSFWAKFGFLVRGREPVYPVVCWSTSVQVGFNWVRSALDESQRREFLGLARAIPGLEVDDTDEVWRRLPSVRLAALAEEGDRAFDALTALILWYRDAMAARADALG